MSDIQFLTVERTEKSLVVALLQNVGCFSQDDFVHEWHAALQAAADPTVATVVLSLRRLPYFGSIVLEMALQLEQRLRARGARLVLCHVSPFGREILRIVHFDRLIPVFKTVEEALATSTPVTSTPVTSTPVTRLRA
jgi:anti-anti-sigma factor